MLLNWEAESKGHVIEFCKDEWGSAFAELGALKELEIELEISIDKKEELLAIISHARTWRFPLKDEKVLTTEGMPMSTSKWQGPMRYWSPVCPYCNHGGGGCERSTSPLKGCEEKRLLREQGKGPECIVVSLRWRVGSA